MLTNPIILPPALLPRARLAVFTPSFPAAHFYPNRLQRGVEALRKTNFEVAVPEAATRATGYTSGSAEERAGALMQLYENDGVDGIICTLGGYNSNAILPFLDYEVIRANPKVFVGHSDATALLLGIFARSGIVTFHGPAILSEWAEFPEPWTYTVDYFLAITGGAAPVEFSPPPSWTNEFLDWGTGADNRPRRQTRHNGWRLVRPGRARGPLIGGNLETMNAVVGTPFCPSFEGALLFVEATDAEAYLPRLERALTHLEISGMLRGIRALLVGRCPDAVTERGVDLYSLVRRFGDRCDVPVVADLDFGHTDPKMTLPLGIEAELIADEHEISFKLLSPAVRTLT